MQYVVFYGMMSGLTSEGIAHTRHGGEGEEGARVGALRWMVEGVNACLPSCCRDASCLPACFDDSLVDSKGSCPPTREPACLPAYLLAHLCACPSVPAWLRARLPACLPRRPPGCMPTCPPACSPTRPSTCLPTCPSASLPTCPSASLPTCPSASLPNHLPC